MLKRENNVRMSNYENNCRFCLEQFGLVNVSLFSEDDAVQDDLISGDSYGRETVTEMVKYCTGIDISPKDNFPQYMCTQCLEKLLQCNRFRRQCLRSAEILKEALTKNVNELNEASDIYDVIADSVGTEDIEIDEELLLGACDPIDDMMTKTANLYPVDQLFVAETQELGLNHNSGVFAATVDSENRKKSQIAEKGVILRDEELTHIWTKLYKSFSVDIGLRNEKKESFREQSVILGEALGTTDCNNSNSPEVIDFVHDEVEIRLDEQSKALEKPLAPVTRRRKGLTRQFDRRKRKQPAKKCQICGEMRINLKYHMLTLHRDLITTEVINNHGMEVKKINPHCSSSYSSKVIDFVHNEAETRLDEPSKVLEKPLAPVARKRKGVSRQFHRKKRKRPTEKCQICGEVRVYLKKHMLTIHRDLITTEVIKDHGIGAKKVSPHCSSSYSSEIIDFAHNDAETRLGERSKALKKPLAPVTRRRKGLTRQFQRRKRKQPAEKCQICGEMRINLKYHMLTIHRDLITTEVIKNHGIGAKKVSPHCSTSYSSEVIDERSKALEKPLAFTGRIKRRNMKFFRRKRKRLAEKCQICGEVRINLKDHMVRLHTDLITTGYSNSSLHVLESRNNRQNQHAQSISVGLGSNFESSHSKVLQGRTRQIKVGIKHKSEHIKLSEAENDKIIHVDCDNVLSEVIKAPGIEETNEILKPHDVGNKNAKVDQFNQNLGTTVSNICDINS